MVSRTRKILGFLSVPVFCGLLAGVILLDFGANSPGPIIGAHAALPELRGGRGCVRCHGDERTTLRESCESCHQAIATQLREGSGIHGRLPRERAEDCGECHEEHRGHRFRPITEQSFVLAGMGSGLRGFTHEGLEFRLTDAHGRLACAKCHEHADADHLPKGCKRFLGLSQECASCHDDPHRGELPDCASCHGQEEPFDRVALFEHDDRFPLSGGHANRSCKACHQRESAFSIENVGSHRTRATELPIRDCVACHESAHDQAFLGSVAGLARVGSAATCRLCHDPEHTGFQAADVPAGRRFHAASGFPLTPPHDAAECASCHRGIGERPGAGQATAVHRDRFPGRRKEQCSACHEDPHRGQFDRGNYAGQSCTACHDSLRFRPAVFSLEHHGRTRFPLTGAHQAVGCQACHRPVPGTGNEAADRMFTGTPMACGQCHADVHDGGFDRQGLDTLVGGRTGCARCHDTNSFGLADPKRFDHGKWTGFDLSGRHGKAACADCHPPMAPSHGGTRRFAKAPASCRDCHRDPHAGQFAVGGVTDCARCHTARSGFDLTIFDHGRHSRFALDEVHRELDCGKCHKTYTAQNGAKIVRYKPLGTQCRDCHGWRSMQEYRNRRDGGRR